METTCVFFFSFFFSFSFSFSFLFSFSSIVAVLKVGRESKGVIQRGGESYTTAIYLNRVYFVCDHFPLKGTVIWQSRFFHFLHYCQFLFIFSSRTFTFLNYFLLS